MKNESYRKRVVCRNKNKNGYIIYEVNGLMIGNAAKRGGFTPKASIKNRSKNNT